ncbi:calcium-dependent phosphotriesterase [Crucibulum laeve]|uniref:Calcium-dependent phosphotriesterase n=1 Tax=Crucibulum laeve TaxID=68775 RepID=A0A5C3LKA6_9AGAR|nr:calcium-dependent phosphotriesterase [Crucibulum laeve]
MNFLNNLLEVVLNKPGALFSALLYATSPPTQGNTSLALPPQSVFVDTRAYAVYGENGTFRQSSEAELFNPTSSEPPFFQIFDTSFLDIIGKKPLIREIASNDTFNFAFEGPIYNEKTNEVFFTSSPNISVNLNNQIGKISLTDVEKALLVASKDSVINVPVTALDIPDNTVQMANGGTGPYKGSLVIVTVGRGPRPPSVVLVNPESPHNTTVLLDNFFGRQFNSLDDVKVHPSGKFFFTDTIYGSIGHIRPDPLIPSQVYRLDPDTREVRVVADGFETPNGIAFTEDGKTAYVSDTGALGEGLRLYPTRPSTIYVFDVDKKTHMFKNRRVFAYIDAGIPDGLQVDKKGNLYVGCGDGVQVWNDQGTLLGKIFVGRTVVNMVFAGDGRLVMVANSKVYIAKIAAKGLPVLFP